MNTSTNKTPLIFTNEELAQQLYRITCLVSALAEIQEISAPYAREVLFERLDDHSAHLYQYFEDLAEADKEVQS